MSKLYLVRHGESVANIYGIYQGQTYDTDLSPLGVKQAEALAEFFETVNLQKIIASPLKRTMQTAAKVSEKVRVEKEVEPQITETNHGEWEGLNKKDIGKDYPEVYKAWLGNPVSVIFPKGESFIETAERIEKFFVASIFDEDTLIVTHDNVIRVILALIEGKTLNNIWDYKLDPGGVTVIDVDYTKDDMYKIIKVNEIGHLGNLRADLSKHAL